MKILFITPYIPTRIRVRPFQIIRELARRHEVHVVALRDIDESKLPGFEDIADAVSEIKVVPHSGLKGILQSLAAFPTGAPMCAAYCRSSRMSSIVEEMISRLEFDIIHVEHLRAAHFLPGKKSSATVFDSVDCLTDLFTQLASSAGNLGGRIVAREEAWKLRRYEPRILAQFDGVVVTTDHDRESLAELTGDRKIEVVPNGVDSEYFAPAQAERKPARIVFSGKMSYEPNSEAVLWFAENVLPDLRREFPDLEFYIVGNGAPPKVEQLSAIPGVHVTGYVEDIRQYLDESSIAIAPMRTAVGIQNKVLEAMSMALPVITTSMVTHTFSGGAPGIIEADSAQEYLENISRLVRNPSEARDIGMLGREEVIRHFSWNSAVNKLESVYLDAQKAFRKVA